MKISEIAKTLFKKGEIDISSLTEQIDKLEGEIPDEQANLLINKLLTVEAAKRDKGIEKHFKGMLYSGVDEKTYETLKDLGFTDEDLKPLKAIESTFDRNKAALQLVKDSEAKKAKNNPDEKLLKSEIEKLTGDLRTLTAAKEAKDKEWQSKLEDIETGYLRKGEFSKHKFRDDIDPEDALLIAERDIDNYLAEKGAKAVRDGNKIKLVRADNPEVEFQDEKYNKVEYSSLVANRLAEKKLLAKSDQGAAGGNQIIINKDAPGLQVDPDVQDFYKQQIAAAGVTN